MICRPAGPDFIAGGFREKHAFVSCDVQSPHPSGVFTRPRGDGPEKLPMQQFTHVILKLQRLQAAPKREKSIQRRWMDTK